jgi:hypothetical protein
MLSPSVFLKMTLVALIGGLITILLGGCATDQLAPPATPTIVTKYQLVKPAAALLADCDIKSTPPDPDTFAAKSEPSEVARLRAQLAQSTDYITALQKDLKNCNSQPRVLRDWFANEDLLYPSTP